MHLSYNPVVLNAIYMFGMPNKSVTSADNGILSSLYSNQRNYDAIPRASAETPKRRPVHDTFKHVEKW